MLTSRYAHPIAAVQDFSSSALIPNNDSFNITGTITKGQAEGCHTNTFIIKFTGGTP